MLPPAKGRSGTSNAHPIAGKDEGIDADAGVANG
jgi:hypothetical protein